jgi:hypothetical protein
MEVLISTSLEGEKMGKWGKIWKTGKMAKIGKP